MYAYYTTCFAVPVEAMGVLSDVLELELEKALSVSHMCVLGMKGQCLPEEQLVLLTAEPSSLQPGRGRIETQTHLALKPGFSQFFSW